MFPPVNLGSAGRMPSTSLCLSVHLRMGHWLHWFRSLQFMHEATFVSVSTGDFQFRRSHSSLGSQHNFTTLVVSTSTDTEIEILKEELASLKAGVVTVDGRDTGRGKKGGAQKGGVRNHAVVRRGRSIETCTKCGKVGHVTTQ